MLVRSLQVCQEQQAQRTKGIESKAGQKILRRSRTSRIGKYRRKEDVAEALKEPLGELIATIPVDVTLC